MLIQGNDFWADDTIRMPHRATPANSQSPPRWRNLFDFLRFKPRSVDASPQMPLQPRRRNFDLFARRTSRPTAAAVAAVVVTPARDEDRYGIAPPTEEEIAAAMQYGNDSIVHSPTSQGQVVAGAQGSQAQVGTQGTPAQIAQGKNYAADTREPGYVIRCCGFVVHFSRQST
ncbi:hypothetical protein K503DRAFT_765265 [Rhizopogon vinicolor AM-OR11-026]|uniref:Uncharacterized protein n=1 Tax=Rhizopogon vinicolor AM-OR11-026 TaxID=1314800 RepID=A0A1B7NGY8_9AGAM|nr:hypothetical protein K503DRAFT_765265 [Rhizopogon vinicolor AM-OR11-026]